MADGLRTLTKPMAAELRPGEQLLGGCKAAGKNAVVKSVGGLAAAALSGGGSAEGWGAVVPQAKVFWIGATSQRLVFFGVGSLTSAPKQFAGEIPWGAVAWVTVGKGTVFRRLTFGFADGSTSVVDLYRANSPDQLQQALQHLLPGRVTEAA